MDKPSRWPLGIPPKGVERHTIPYRDVSVMADGPDKEAEHYYRRLVWSYLQEARRKRAERDELRAALAECCRMFEWCEARYGNLLPGEPR